MRIVMAAALALLVTGTADRSSATEYPWCADYSMPGGATNCGFSTYAQCYATIAGIGGTCRQNSFFRGLVTSEQDVIRTPPGKRRPARPQ